MKKEYLLIPLFICFLLPQTMPGQSGVLDLTFGQAGMVFSNEGFFILPLPSKKIMALRGLEQSVNDYDIQLHRFNYDGSPDSTFGINSYRTINLSESTNAAPSVDDPADMVLLPNGKILVCGTIFDHYNQGAVTLDGFILCLNENGEIDSTFGDFGVINLDIGDDIFESVGYLTLDADNKLLAVGGVSGKWVMARFDLGLYTPTQAPINNETMGASLIPNIVYGNRNLLLKYQSEKLGSCKVQVSGMDGSLALEHSFSCFTAGWQEAIIELPKNLAAGLYALKLQTPSGSQTLKFVVVSEDN